MTLEEFVPMLQVLHMVTHLLHLNVPAQLIVIVQVHPTHVIAQLLHQFVNVVSTPTNHLLYAMLEEYV